MKNLEYRVVNDGIFMPAGLTSKLDVVYDSNSRIVEDSCVLRGKDKSENVSQPLEYLPEEMQSKVQYIDEPLLFMGMFAHMHYGHLLTEGLARYWFVLENPKKNWKIPTSKDRFTLMQSIKCHIKPQKCVWKNFLRPFGLKTNDFVFAPKPLQAREVIVPQCSMYNRSQIHSSHLAVAKKIAQSIIGSSSVGHDPTPVYLSRAKLKKSMKSYIGEPPIEAYCKDMGCKIVYPERLSLKEQIVLFNRHDVYVGAIGSAFHSVLFRFADRPATNIYLTDGFANENYVMIDDLMGNDSHFIECATVQESWGTQVLDSDKAIAALAGLLGPRA